LPVPLEYHGFHKAVDMWRRWSGAYVAFAVTLFVYLLSRNVVYAAAAAILFSLLAYAFREYAKRGEPVMLAIAAVTLSTMHQSSLGSLFLLMPDKLAPQWWSPAMPVLFLFSAVAAGTAVVILVEFWIAKAWSRRLSDRMTMAMGKITFWALLVYLVSRVGDLTSRQQLASAFSGKAGWLFAAEIILGGLVPLVLLGIATKQLRRDMLFAGSLLCALGVVFNRINVVIWAMDLRGPMPQNAPAPYSPSLVEWGISIGLIAAAIFLFGLGVRLFPVLPEDTASQES
jgi:formate dehydrogenase iron-sulfur subunit